MCEGEIGNGAVRSFRPYLECAETWRDAQHIVSPQNPFHLPEIVIETDWVTMMLENQEEVFGRGGEARADAILFATATPHASWFDVRVIYVRVSGCCCSDDAPEALSLRFPPRNISTALEVDGARISPSEEAHLVLKRDKVDPESAEATYLSTDYVRTSGPLSFQVFFKDEALVAGTLEHSEANSVEERDDDNGCNNSTLVKRIERPWSLDCSCVVGQTGCVFSQGRQDYNSFVSFSLPAMEVCLVRRNFGTPVILSQTVHLTARRRSNRQTTLDVIPEAEELGKRGSLMMINDLALRNNCSLFGDLTEKAAAGRAYGFEAGGYGDGDDGQMTWFNAGVRVGVGLGLGMCLGVGIGVGLIARTFHATSKTLRKECKQQTREWAVMDMEKACWREQGVSSQKKILQGKMKLMIKSALGEGVQDKALTTVPLQLQAQEKKVPASKLSTVG